MKHVFACLLVMTSVAVVATQSPAPRPSAEPQYGASPATSSRPRARSTMRPATRSSCRRSMAVSTPRTATATSRASPVTARWSTRSGSPGSTVRRAFADSAGPCSRPTSTRWSPSTSRAARSCRRPPVPGATFLNDLATAPDGTVYVSDSFASRIYVVRNGKASVFVEGAELVETANGLLVDGNRLILGTVGRPRMRPGWTQRWGPGASSARRRSGDRTCRPAGGGRGRGGPAAGGNLYAFDLTTKARTRLTTDAVGGVDGVEPDGRGGRAADRRRRPAPPPCARRRADPGRGRAGGWRSRFRLGRAARSLAIVPFLNENKVEAYDLSARLK